MGKALAKGRVYRLPNCCREIYRGKFGKFYEAVRTVTDGVDREVEIFTQRKILDRLHKPQKSVRELVNLSRQKIIDIFLNLKKFDFKITLDELKNFDFCDAVLIIQKGKNLEREQYLKRV